MRLILLNGPPGSGKDTLARALVEECARQDIDWVVLRMSHPIKRAFAGLVNADIDEWGNVDEWEGQKDVPSDLLNGKSYRQWQIEFSEVLMKPLYGNDIFVRLFASSVTHLQMFEDWNGYVIVPDLGFPIEADRLVELLPNEQKMLVRIRRPGCDYSKDSRGYVYPTSIPLQDNFHNCGTMGDIARHARYLLTKTAWQGFAG